MFELETNLSRRLSKERPVTLANPGTPEKTVFSGKYDDDGKLVVVPVGKINLYEEIQTYRDSVDINSILDRFAAGDDSSLQKVSGFFADVSELPDSYVGFFNMIQECKDFFEKLPSATKEKYGNNFESFMASAEANDFLPKIVQQPTVKQPNVQQPTVQQPSNVLKPEFKPSNIEGGTNES